MAKRRKNGQVIKPKRKYASLKGIDKLGQGVTAQQVPLQPQDVRRASVNTYMFIQGNRVYIRNLDDITLINESGRLRTRCFELNYELATFEELSVQMNREKEFREL